MKIIKVEIGKDQLLSIPELEYTFFLSLGHIVNEINAVTKMMYWASITPTYHEADENGRFDFVRIITAIKSEIISLSIIRLLISMEFSQMLMTSY
ncbi:MAG: hypothetical protein ROW52_12000 [Anaerolineaceae bacterium]|jgi:hypothetical protein